MNALRIGLPALLLTLVFAQPASAAPLKVGVFDKQRIVDESQLGLAARGRFEELQSQREGEVAEKQKTLEKLQQSYQQKAQVLSEEKRLQLQRELVASGEKLGSRGPCAVRPEAQDLLIRKCSYGPGELLEDLIHRINSMTPGP